MQHSHQHPLHTRNASNGAHNGFLSGKSCCLISKQHAVLTSLLLQSLSSRHSLQCRSTASGRLAGFQPLRWARLLPSLQPGTHPLFQLPPTTVITPSPVPSSFCSWRAQSFPSSFNHAHSSSVYHFQPSQHQSQSSCPPTLHLKFKKRASRRRRNL